MYFSVGGMAEGIEKPMEDMTVSSSTDEEPIFTSESRGSDECGDGTKKVPYKTILQAMRRFGKEPFPVIYQDAKEGSEAHKEGKLYDVVAKAQIKKMTKLWKDEIIVGYPFPNQPLKTFLFYFSKNRVFSSI